MIATASAPDTAAAARPTHVQVYGNDHSPWVQAVLLGLREKGVAYTNVLAPPLPVFARSGVLMPAARIDDGPWQLDSERILVALGFNAVSESDRSALQAIFGMSALSRADDAWSFWHRFSLVRDGDPRLAGRLWHQLWRAFSMFYFFVLIRIAGRRVPRSSHEAIVDGWVALQSRLRDDAPFIGGDAPGTVDLQLFGLVQMCASIPGPSLEALRSDAGLERLRSFIGAMHARFATYEHLYTACLFDPHAAEVAPAPAIERCAYWLGTVVMWLACPVTLPIALYYVQRIRKTGMLRD